MPSTIGWFAVAIMAGAVVGLAIGHWSVVVAWLGRCLQDPVPPPAEREPQSRDGLGRTS